MQAENTVHAMGIAEKLNLLFPSCGKLEASYQTPDCIACHSAAQQRQGHRGLLLPPISIARCRHAIAATASHPRPPLQSLLNEIRPLLRCSTHRICFDQRESANQRPDEGLIPGLHGTTGMCDLMNNPREENLFSL